MIPWITLPQSDFTPHTCAHGNHITLTCITISQTQSCWLCDHFLYSFSDAQTVIKSVCSRWTDNFSSTTTILRHSPVSCQTSCCQDRCVTSLEPTALSPSTHLTRFKHSGAPIHLLHSDTAVARRNGRGEGPGGYIVNQLILIIKPGTVLWIPA